MDTNEIGYSKKDSKTLNKFNINYYNKMSSENFEIFCKRFLTLHTTGVYTPPPSKPVFCKNKKQNRTGPRKYTVDDRKRSTTFGKGRVGVSCESYGIKNCACCQQENQPGIRVLRNIVPARSQHANESEIYEAQIQEILSNSNKYNNETKSEQVENKTLSPMEIIEIDTVGQSESQIQKSLLDGAEIHDDSVIFINDSAMNIDNPITSYLSPVILSSTNDSVNDSIINIDDSIHITNFEKPAPSSSYSCPIILSSDSESDTSKNKNMNRRVKSKRIKILNKKKVGSSTGTENKYYVKYDSTSVRLKSQNLLQKLKNDIQAEDEFFSKKKSLNTSTVGNKDEENSDLKCPICFDTLRNKEILSTMCGHIFCAACIRNSIKIYKFCPVCRKALTLKRLHPIYL